MFYCITVSNKRRCFSEQKGCKLFAVGALQQTAVGTHAPHVCLLRSKKEAELQLDAGTYSVRTWPCAPASPAVDIRKPESKKAACTALQRLHCAIYFGTLCTLFLGWFGTSVWGDRHWVRHSVSGPCLRTAHHDSSST